MHSKIRAMVLALVATNAILSAQEVVTLPSTGPLMLQGDLSAQMIAGIDTFLLGEIENSVSERQKVWRRDFASREAYEKSVQPNRERLRKCIGAVDPRLPVTALEFISSTADPARVGETERCEIFAVRWPVFEGVFGEGLLLQPKGGTVARIIVIPDADQTPEMLAGLAPGLAPESQFARRLAENGCEVIVLTLIDRAETFSGNADIHRFTNQPHREWIYRQAFELGRHVIGYEVQKVLAAVDWFEQNATNSSTRHSAPDTRHLPVGLAGYGEGGLIALYSAALDTRIEATLVSGYFDSRQRVWQEPVYRNVFGLLSEFGDAEIASLTAPRTLLIEHSPAPDIRGPPAQRPGRAGAAPGRWTTPDFESVEGEVARLRALAPAWTNRIEFIYGNEGSTTGPGSEPALRALLRGLGVTVDKFKPPQNPPAETRKTFKPAERQRRQVEQLVEHTQRLLRLSEQARENVFWKSMKTNSVGHWDAACQPFRAVLRDEVIGSFPKSVLPPNARSRKIYDTPKWTGYEVVLDLFPNVFAWGVLLLPKDLKPGERRPVVVCQHGRGGVPADTITEDVQSAGYRYYKAYAARLAERGFVVFAPHNPYRGEEQYRRLQRKANPIKKSLFSIILAQHERILDWLATQPFVDPHRIGFYGLSYGGKTAMRIPSLLDGYALSICSADFNECIRKNAGLDFEGSFMFTEEYEMPEFNLGGTFNYAEMAALIAPRPFMVERGHDDGVALDEWVGYEYAKVRRLYDRLGIPERTEIEIFNGPHTINGQGTFKFLHKHLNWPEPK